MSEVNDLSPCNNRGCTNLAPGPRCLACFRKHEDVRDWNGYTSEQKKAVKLEIKEYRSTLK